MRKAVAAYDLGNQSKGEEKKTFESLLKNTVESLKHSFQKEPELTNYDAWQLEKHGNILPSPVVLPSGEIENGHEGIQRHAEWVEQQAAQQLHEYEKY
jgi:hypothetical protein